MRRGVESVDLSTLLPGCTSNQALNYLEFQGLFYLITLGYQRGYITRGRKVRSCWKQWSSNQGDNLRQSVWSGKMSWSPKGLDSRKLQMLKVATSSQQMTPRLVLCHLKPLTGWLLIFENHHSCFTFSWTKTQEGIQALPRQGDIAGAGGKAPDRHVAPWTLDSSPREKASHPADQRVTRLLVTFHSGCTGAAPVSLCFISSCIHT